MLAAKVFWPTTSCELSIQGKFLQEKYFQVICAFVYPAYRIDRYHWAMHCDACNVWPHFTGCFRSRPTTVLKRVDQFQNELTSFKTSWPVSKRVDRFRNIYVASYSSCAILLLDPITHCDQSHDYIIATAGPHMNCDKVHLAREGSCCVNAVFIWLIAMSVLCAAG